MNDINTKFKMVLLPVLIAALTSLLSSYLTGSMMLKQQAIALQESREKLTGDNAYKDLQKIRKLSFELYCLTEQFVVAVEKNYDDKALSKMLDRLRDKGYELYLQAGYSFGSNALGIVQASEDFMNKKNKRQYKKEGLLNKLRYSKQQFFAKYPTEMATYQKYALPNK